jgi:hypothetical protein
MMKIRSKISAGLAAISLFGILLPSCEVTQQAQQMYNLVNCDFRILSADHITLAGINISNYHSLKDLNMTDVLKLTTAMTQPAFPLSLRLNLEGKNPNTTPAGLSRFDYILFIDDIQMTEGTFASPVTIPPNNGTAVIPMQLTIDLKKVLQGKSADAIMNFGFNLSGNGNKPTRILVKIKPSITIGSSVLSYPGYINVRTEFGGNK